MKNAKRGGGIEEGYWTYPANSDSYEEESIKGATEGEPEKIQR